MNKTVGFSTKEDENLAEEVVHHRTKLLQARVEALEKAHTLVKAAMSLLRDGPPFPPYDWDAWITAAQSCGYDAGDNWEPDEEAQSARKLLEPK